MNDQTRDLARRAVACKHWRWMPGMRAFEGSERFRVFEVLHGYPSGVNEQNASKNHIDPGLNWMPDLTDPATLGCLLALVRQAWNDSGISCVTSSYSNGRYYRRVVDGHHHGSTFQTLSQVTHLTEADALVAALEAAP